MRAEKKTALIVVDMLKGLTTEGGYNYYPTAGKMMEEGFSEKIEKTGKMTTIKKNCKRP